MAEGARHLLLCGRLIADARERLLSEAWHTAKHGRTCKLRNEISINLVSQQMNFSKQKAESPAMSLRCLAQVQDVAMLTQVQDATLSVDQQDIYNSGSCDLTRSPFQDERGVVIPPCMILGPEALPKPSEPLFGQNAVYLDPCLLRDINASRASIIAN